MDIENLIKAGILRDEYDKFKRLKENLEEVSTDRDGILEISTPPMNRSPYRFGFSERDNEFLEDIREAVRRHLQRIADEIEAL